MFKHSAILLRTALALLIGLTALVAPIVSRAATTGSVQGTVRDSSGNPLPNVLVSVVEAGYRQKTDASGHYQFIGITPGAYTVQAALVTFKTTVQSVTVTQDVASTIDFSLEKQVVNTGITRVTGTGVIQRAKTDTSTVITKKVEQEKKSQPYELYQTPGLVIGEPGITMDPGTGNIHIRGSDYNQTGYQVDGVSITDPGGNGFVTNLVTVGLQSANFVTNATDASYGGSTGGFINVLTNNGKDLANGKSFLEGTFGPTHGWNYQGYNLNYGDITADKKFDYAISNIQFRNSFPKDLFGLRSVNQSFDGFVKTNYYADPNNTLTAFVGHGYEQYDFPQDQSATGLGGATPSTYKFDPHAPIIVNGVKVGQGAFVDTKQFQQDHEFQNYEQAYLGYKHNFNANSFFTYRLARLKSLYDENDSSANTGANINVNYRQTIISNTFDYTNQLTHSNQLRLGALYQTFNNKSDLAETYSGFGADGTPTAIGPHGLLDEYRRAGSNIAHLYLQDQIRFFQDKMTLNLGGQYGTSQFTPAAQGDANYTDHYVDPRLGLAYSPSTSFAIRTGYTVQSQFPDTNLIERVAPEALDKNGKPFGPATSISPAGQLAYFNSRYATFNKLSTEHSYNFDLGFEKGFSAFDGGSYDVTVTGFQRIQKNLPQYTRISYVPLGGLRGYDSSGHGRDSGVEFGFYKRLRKESDLNGELTYTNQVATATSDRIDTAYYPFFYSAFAGNGLNLTDAQFRAGNNAEYATTYAQRHTVYALIDKRVSKLLESALSLDAGSGFPFVYGQSIFTAKGGTSVGTDVQHTTQNGFNEIPVLLPDQRTLAPINPVAGHSGWHYKLTLNTNFYLTPTTNLFLNVDNLFDRETTLIYSTVNQRGQTFYTAPSAQYPQGRVYYGPNVLNTPVSVQFGFRTRF